jgi:alkylation response protein AidB-like acyl-CoA dehydrogenase
MGLEVDEKYGGAGASFMSAILTIEELAKVDPSISAVVDVHNTLVNTMFNHHANEAQKEKYLPGLCNDHVIDN